MIRHNVVDVLSGGGKPLTHPAVQLLLPLLGKFHGLDVLRHGGGELLQPAVPCVGDLAVEEHQRAVLREVLQQRDQRTALRLVQLEDVHIRHRDQRVLRHHGHRLRRLGDLLHGQPLASETVVVELLEARRHQMLLQFPDGLLHEVRLLAEEDIHVPHRVAFHGTVQLLIAGELLFLFLCHSYPPFTVMRTVPCVSVRQISAPTSRSRCIVSCDG